MNVPNLYFVRTSNQNETGGHVLVPRRMRDFVGLETVDQAMITALMEFSYNLTIGNLDEVRWFDWLMLHTFIRTLIDIC